MEGVQNRNGKTYYRCATCSTEYMDGITYISHIQSKRHVRNLSDRSRPQPNDKHNRTLQVTGLPKNVPVEGIINVFLKYGVRQVNRANNAITVEFNSIKGAAKALECDNYWENSKLQVSPIKYNKYNAGRRSVPVTPHMWNKLRTRATDTDLKRLIYDFITEIELKPKEHADREYLKQIMERFLMPNFNMVRTFIFGSSANNLGFSGCDVDLYADLGVNPWDPSYSRAEAQANASDLTWFLSREIRSKRRGTQIQAVPRARVPIVKFKEVITKLQVDLSFRHNMPVFNTQLIHQYTMTHDLVRPYMMLIRCWAKIQNVAGGGEPTFLITNYALCLMMVFYLMYRSDPIVPSVMHLRQISRSKPYIVAGWDCSFSNNVTRWSNKYHNVSIMGLVAEFFEFYSKLEASRWVVSPFAGTLIEKSYLKDRDMRKLPQCMLAYCQQDIDMQSNTPLCVQDAFELSHNCTRGLKKGPLAEFQYKCSVAAQISRGVAEGTQSLSDFLEVIEMTPAILERLIEREDADEDKGSLANSKRESVNELKAHEGEGSLTNSKKENTGELPEIITVDDSQDSVVELKNSDDVQIVGPFKEDENFLNLDVKRDADLSKSKDWKNNLKKCSILNRPLIRKDNNEDEMEAVNVNSPLSKPCKSGDFLSLYPEDDEILNKKNKLNKNSTDCSSSDVEILEEVDSDSDIESKTAPVKLSAVNTNMVSGSDSITGCQMKELLDTEPGQFPLKCIIMFDEIPEFTINFDGDVSGSRHIMTQQDDVAQAACSLINFTLQQCFKIEMSVIEEFSGNKKRKTQEMEDDTDSSKRLKTENGECIPVSAKYRRLAQYMCRVEFHLWNGRKKVTKTVPKQSYTTPLQYELAITEAQMLTKNIRGKDNPIDCIIEVWQSCNKASYIILTGKLLEQEKNTKGSLTQMFSHYASFVQNLLRKITHHVLTTSSKR